MRAWWFELLAGCSFEPGIAPGDGGGSGSDGGIDGMSPDAMIDAMSIDTPPGSTLRQKTITIDAAITGTHTDFPLWISLLDSDLAARARADGTDIHFVQGSVELDFEIQRWTKNEGRLEAWVRVPSLATNTQIAIRYGDVAAAHAPDAPGTFAGYNAVWHLDDALNQSTIADTRNQTNGTGVGLGPSDSVAAQLGRGIAFGDDAERITFTNPLSGNTAHTISVWINQAATNTNDAIIAMGNPVQHQARWFHSRYFAPTIAVGFYTNDYVNPNEDIIGDGWVLLHWVYEGTNRMTRLYRNGAQVGSTFQHMPGVNTQGTAGTIGNTHDGFGTNMGINATLDEIRIINVARSAAWIAAEALNQATPVQFYSVSAEQMP